MPCTVCYLGGAGRHTQPSLIWPGLAWHGMQAALRLRSAHTLHVCFPLRTSAQAAGQVEPEAVDVELLHPAHQAVDDQPLHLRAPAPAWNALLTGSAAQGATWSLCKEHTASSTIPLPTCQAGMHASMAPMPQVHACSGQTEGIAAMIQ